MARVSFGEHLLEPWLQMAFSFFVIEQRTPVYVSYLVSNLRLGVAICKERNVLYGVFEAERVLTALQCELSILLRSKKNLTRVFDYKGRFGSLVLSHPSDQKPRSVWATCFWIIFYDKSIVKLRFGINRLGLGLDAAGIPSLQWTFAWELEMVGRCGILRRKWVLHNS